MAKTENTRSMVQIALLSAIIVLLAFTPLGFIPLGFMRATTLHIPVIIGAILLGPKAGAVLGGVFGLCSVIINTITPTITSFVFSPFYSLGETSGNGFSLVIAMVPRILIGVVAHYVYQLMIKLGRKEGLSCLVAGIAGSMTNTVLVMGSIYIFFGESYAAAREIAFEALFGVIMTTVGINGVPEAVVAGILTTAIVIPLGKILRRPA